MVMDRWAKEGELGGRCDKESSRHDALLCADDTDGHGGDRTGVRYPPPESASSGWGLNHPEQQSLRACFLYLCWILL